MTPLAWIKSFFDCCSPDGTRTAFIAGKYPTTEIHVIPTDSAAGRPVAR